MPPTKTILCVVLCSLASQAQSGTGCTKRIVLVQAVAAKPSSVRFPASAFRAELEGKAIPIVSVTPVAGSRRVVIALDTSGSMGDPAVSKNSTRWAFARSAAKELLAAIPADAPVAFIAQSSDVQETVRFSADSRKQIATRLEQLASESPKGRTPLLTEIDQAWQLLKPERLGDEIILITDGGENSSKGSWRELAKRLAIAGVRVSVILLVTPSPRSKEELEGPSLMRDIAEQTGGLNLSVDADILKRDARENSAFLAELVELARDAGWMIELRLQEAPRKSVKWKLRVVDDQRRLVRGLTLIYPRWWPACTN